MTFNGFTSTDPFGMAYICQIYCSDSELNISGAGRPELDAEIKSVNLLLTDQQFSAGNEVEIEALQTHGVMPVLIPAQIVAVKGGLANYGAGLFFTALPQNIGYQSRSDPGRRRSAIFECSGRCVQVIRKGDRLGGRDSVKRSLILISQIRKRALKCATTESNPKPGHLL